MKKYSWILLLPFAAGLPAADAPKTNSTNSPAAGTNEPPAAKVEAGTIPDATHKPVFTTNTVAIAGRRVTYIAETGMLPILKTDGTSRASVFYVAYTRTGQTNLAARPVMFCFNGGPGSSSVWLHLGALGPRRVKMNEDGTLPPLPFGLVDNEYSILDGSDLVFIDPVATDYLIKPFHPEELVSKVEKLLGRSQRLLAGRTNPERKPSHPHKKSSPASSGDK